MYSKYPQCITDGLPSGWSILYYNTPAEHAWTLYIDDLLCASGEVTTNHDSREIEYTRVRFIFLGTPNSETEKLVKSAVENAMQQEKRRDDEARRIAKEKAKQAERFLMRAVDDRVLSSISKTNTSDTEQ